MAKIAVLYFPGNNCEEETKRAVEAAGLQADILRWNITPKLLEEYDGYIIPGGFAYEDRVRAGVIAAKQKIMGKIQEETEKGKILLGICNGAQVLVETGMIPGLQRSVQMALAPNDNPKISGYYCTWIRLKNIAKKKNAFNQYYSEAEIIPMPIAHGEGKFTTRDTTLLEQLKENEQIAFRYCNADGEFVDTFPVNPNGAMFNIAAISNKEGNIMAIMPHPERASWKKQLPEKQLRNFQDGELAGPGRKVFESMGEWLR